MVGRSVLLRVRGGRLAELLAGGWRRGHAAWLLARVRLARTLIAGALAVGGSLAMSGSLALRGALAVIAGARGRLGTALARRGRHDMAEGASTVAGLGRV